MMEQIQQALRVLTGTPLWHSHRAANLQSFHFGQRREVPTRFGRTSFVGEYALHVQCAWRIIGRKGIVVGSGDCYYGGLDPEHESSDLDEDQLEANRCDARIAEFFAEQQGAPPMVEGIHSDAVGSVRVVLSGGFVLDVFPDDSMDHEHWRLLRPGTTAPHFVVTGSGIRED